MTTIVGYRSRLDPEPVVVPRAEPVVWGDGSTPGPLNTHELGSYERRGYLTFEALLSGDEVTRLAGEAARLAGDSVLGESELVVREPNGPTVRSVFDIHRLSDMFARLAADERLAGRARQILGSDVYVHQSRVNFKPGFRGKEFYWHSDFETWHVEDGLPEMRALSVSITLTENLETNGSLMVVPGSHRTFVGCVGETPQQHYRRSLRAQEFGVPDDDTLGRLVSENGIEQITGPPGSAILFDCNVMHGSSSNITPFPRSNLFIVYNSVLNPAGEPAGGMEPRPEFVAHRQVERLEPLGR